MRRFFCKPGLALGAANARQLPGLCYRWPMPRTYGAFGASRWPKPASREEAIADPVARAGRTRWFWLGDSAAVQARAIQITGYEVAEAWCKPGTRQQDLAPVHTRHWPNSAVHLASPSLHMATTRSTPKAGGPEVCVGQATDVLVHSSACPLRVGAAVPPWTKASTSTGSTSSRPCVRPRST